MMNSLLTEGRWGGLSLEELVVGCGLISLLLAGKIWPHVHVPRGSRGGAGSWEGDKRIGGVDP